jgi:Carboxypeptidase regulatory-like domain
MNFREQRITLACLVSPIVMAAVLFLSSFQLQAQNAGSGSLDGTVSDETGAVVPDAQIVVTNQANGATQTTKTSANGFYSVEALPGGDYQLVITKDGFRTDTIKDLHLDPGARRGVDVKLQVGATTAQISVEADTVSVQTESGENGGTISAKQVSQLMLDGRNFQTLATIVPGVTAVTGANQLGPGGASNGGQVQLSIGGTSVEQTAYLIDGIYDSVPSGNLTLSVLPAIDAIQEFRVLENNYGANYGFAGSGQILVQTRSGGTTYHGTAYDYIRNNNFLTAKNFFTEPNTPYGLHQNIFGYSIGGPLIIPKIYNPSPKRTFFFASGQWYLSNSSQSLTRAFYPEPMRTGNFSASPTLPGAGALSLDASSNALLAGRGLNPATCLSAGPNGRITQISQTCMDPVSVALMNTYFPLPNAVVPGQFNNYVNSNPQKLSDSNVLYRGDHAINQKNQLMGRVMYEETDIVLAARNYNDPAPNPGAASYTTGLNAMVRWTSNFTPKITNSAQVAENFQKGANTLRGMYTLPDGITINRPLGSDPLNRVPSMQINGGWSWLGVGAYPTYSHDGQFMIGDDLSWLKGSHVLQFGGLYMIGIRRANVATGNVPHGNYVFSGVHTGDPAADFLLGLDASFVQINAQRSGNFHYRWFEGYFQDDYRATPRLTLNAGLRWSYYGPTTADGNQLANFQPADFNASQAPLVKTNGTLVTNAQGQPVTSSGATANLTNGLLIAGQNGTPAGFINPRHTYFGPRFGFAYQLTSDGKTAIHGGYGIGYTQVSLENTVILLPNPPYTQNISITNSLMSNPGAGATAAASVQALQAIGYDFRSGMIQTYSLTVQREIVPHGVLSVGYAGNLQQHILSTQLDGNFPLSETTAGTPACAALSPTPETSTNYQFDPCLNTGATAKAYYRPYQGYDQILSTMSGGIGNYNGLQTGFVYRAHDLTLNLAYTFSRALTDVVPANPGSNGGSGVGYDSVGTFQNSRDIRAEYGKPDFDRTHVLTGAPVYELPYFRNSPNLFERELLSGWTFSGLAILESGYALTPSDTYGDAGLATRPNQLQKIHTQGSGKVGIGQHNYFTNPAGIYAQPAYGFFGTAANGSIIGPREIAFNVSTAKTFPVTERVGAKLGLEAFNVFNHPNITGISTQYGAANFGQAISAGDPRIMEGVFRLSF